MTPAQKAKYQRMKDGPQRLRDWLDRVRAEVKPSSVKASACRMWDAAHAKTVAQGRSDGTWPETETA